MKTARKVFMLLASLSIVTATACSSGTDKQTTPKDAPKDTPKVEAVATEPVTLSFLQTSAKMTDEEFKMWVTDPVKKKYPNITVNLVREDNPDKLAEQVAAGNLPDVIYAGPVTAQKIVDLQAAQDLTDLMKKNNITEDKFDPAAIDIVKQLSSNGKILALPLAINFSVLYYNKDLFDKFAVPYPKDGMLWTDAIELAKKLTRSEGGTQYKGIAIDGNINRLGEQLSLPMVDVKAGKAALQTDGWKNVFTTYRNIAQIQGNWLENPQRIPAFQKDKNLAMLVGLSARLGEFEQMQSTGQGMNWDMVSTPTFQEAPKKAFGGGVFYLMQSLKSKHPTEAFAVLKMLLDDDAQSMISKQGRRSSMKDPKFSQVFGDDLKSLNGKNKAAIFKTDLAMQVPTNVFYDVSFKELVAGGNRLASEPGTDINTILRETDEKINKAMEPLKGK